MEVGISVDPQASRMGLALWYDGELEYAGLWLYRGRAKSTRKAVALAKQVTWWLQEDYTIFIDWLSVEGQVIRRGGPVKSIMRLQACAETFTATLEQRLISLGGGITEIYRPLPEEWKGSMSKLATEYHIMGNSKVNRPGILSEVERNSIVYPTCWIPHRERTSTQRGLASDVFDAIGIGLATLRRF